MKSLHVLAALIWGGMACAQDVVIIGEVHDNPAHHALQAKEVGTLQPAALVFEMLTAEQAALVTGNINGSEATLEKLLSWSQGGWPDFGMYYPIFTASAARIYGAAVPREVARASLSTGIAAGFGDGADRYGLTEVLPDQEQAAREHLQAAAHCDALPEDMLASMVDIQRLRDAVLARAVVQAVSDTGGPVVVITGNGHARRDWGVPAVLARAAPELSVHVIGQTEDEAQLEGGFDRVISAPAADRPDPCLAFR